MSWRGSFVRRPSLAAAFCYLHEPAQQVDDCNYGPKELLGPSLSRDLDGLSRTSARCRKHLPASLRDGLLNCRRIVDSPEHLPPPSYRSVH